MHFWLGKHLYDFTSKSVKILQKSGLKFTFRKTGVLLLLLEKSGIPKEDTFFFLSHPLLAFLPVLVSSLVLFAGITYLRILSKDGLPANSN